MRRAVTFAVLVGCLALTHFAAQAQTRNIGSFGAWTAFAGSADDGTPVCGIRASGADGRALLIKYFRGDESFLVQIFKSSWQAADGVNVRLSLQWGNQAPRVVSGIARRFAATNSGFVEVALPFSSIEEFWTGFRLADRGVIQFLSGNESAWSISLTGSNAATNAMVNCINRMDRSTQPYAGQPSQPFEAGRPQSPVTAPPEPSFDPAARGGASKF